MAIDYIIGALQLLSAAVNVLALAAFWITPGLRTTANRFVINLLVVNIVGCLALTPALFLHGGLKPETQIERHPINDILDRLVTDPSFGADQISAKFQSECTEFGGSRECDSILIKTNADLTEIFQQSEIERENGDKVKDLKVVREIQANKNDETESTMTLVDEKPTKNVQFSDCTRFWGFDLVAALGGLSVLLVVGDTWCAVTDPLRYHSRVSGLKSWILILTTWLISILFCIASALRSDCRLITTEITSTLQHAYFKASNREIPAETILSPSSNIDLTQSNVEIDKIYNLIYSCTFFVVIILMPICLVCAMYWKIFSEARQNGLRMRQNGSSPLLQSALNLAATAQVPVTADNCCSVIGEEDVDDDTASNSEQREHIQTISAMRRASVAGTSSHHVVINDSPISINRIHFNQHRNRYLEIPKFAQITQQKQHSIGSTNSSSTHGKTTQNGELRQVHSTPDLQKSICIELMASGDTKRQSNRNDVNSALPAQTSTIFTPPKALSYMTSIRHRLSNASSIFKYREESRAARISVLVVIMFLFSYFPYGLLVLLQGRVHFIANSSLLGVLFLLIANMTSPFIFAYRNRRVRRGVCRLFGVDAKTNERLQKQRILMRSSTIGSSCRDTSRKQKTKIVRIIRNSPKSASFSLGMKSTDIYTPIATQTTIIDEKIKSKVNECDKSVELDDRKSDSIINQKMISNQNVTMINGEKEMPYDVIINIGNSATPMTQSTFNCNSASVSASVIKQKILLFKRVCKLSNNSSDISCINRTPFECNVNTTKPVNV